MARVVFIVALAALTFSLTKSATEKPKDGSKMMEPKPDERMDDSANMLMEAMNDCNGTYAIDKSYTRALNDSGSFPDETDRQPKCYIRCVMEKVGIASNDGVYDSSKATMFIEVFRTAHPNKPSFKDLAEQCSDRKETCKCDRAYQYVKCIIQADIKNNNITTN